MRAVLVGILLLLPLHAFSDEAAILELQSQIQQLMAEIAAVQLELQVAETNQLPQSPACPQFTRSMRPGTQGNDVRTLQSFLMQTKDFPDSETTAYFGPKTEKAVRSFQCREMGICDADVGSGVVGPMTREAIARVCAEGFLVAHSQQDTAEEVPSVVVSLVCAQPPATCDDGPSCSAIPSAKTYTNDDARAAAGAAFLHTGACRCGDEGIACQGANARTCSFWGRTIAHGQTVAAFKQGRAASLSLCESESRECTNGTLSGSFAYASCSL